MPPPDVSVIMPVHQCEATLAPALEAVLAQRSQRLLEVVVVDDGSTDRTAEVAAEIAARDPRVRLLRKANGGEASALNAGWPQTRGDFVAIVEGDVEPNPDWLEGCLAALQVDPGAWGAGGRLETDPSDPWIARLAGYEVERKFAGKPQEARHLTSANVVYRREAFDLAGPFDERLVNASLDSVFNSRLVAAGKRLIYVSGARALHHYKGTLLGFLRRHYAYGRFRVHNPFPDLYPADRALRWKVALGSVGALGTLAAPLAIVGLGPLGVLLVITSQGLLVLCLLGEVPDALRVLWQRRDPAGVLLPPVRLVRNVVAACGYARGLMAVATGGV